MSKAILKKHLSDNIGRMFNLAFNQTTMYNVYHKSAVSAVERFNNFLQDGFKILDNVAISINQEKIFIEDEPLDARINTSKLTAYFKKTGIQSISFSSGLDLGDVTSFFEVLTDLRRYRNADEMKKVLAKRGLDKVTINYFVYAKVKTGETVVQSELVGKGRTGDGQNGVPTSEDILTIMAADILSEELQKNISIQGLMQSPADFSQMLIREDMAASQQSEQQNVQPGTTLAHSLNRFQKEIDGVLAGRTDVNISELAENVFELKQQLLRGIEDQKSKGIVYLDEQKIREGADEITDGVLVKLITEEYQKGAVSIRRLAQITLRLVSEATELQRILPKLKRALLAYGMPLADFLIYIQEVKNELQSEELTSVLEKSAEAIGLEGEDLIREIMKNPQNAAELIYLASEIRKSGEDTQVLSNMMVDYVDRAGAELTMQEIGKTDDVSGEKIDTVFSRIRSEILGKLKQREIDSNVLANLEKRLTERMEESIRQLKSTMVFKQMSGVDAGTPTTASILKLLQSHTKDERERNEILKQVKTALSEKGIESKEFDKLYTELEKKASEKKETETQTAPPGSLNRGSTLFILEKEIKRANRYDTPFSILSFSIVKATPKTAAKPGSITTDDVIAAFVAELTEIIRETDLAGMLGAKMIVVIQPMTEGENAKIALARITNGLKSREFKVKGVPFDIVFAGIATPYDTDRTPDIKAFVRLAQMDLKNIVDRISNIQRMI